MAVRILLAVIPFCYHRATFWRKRYQAMSSIEPPNEQRAASDSVAAVDLGSNSFHLIVAHIGDGHYRVIDRHKEMVRLGEGLTSDKDLKPEVAERALACLERMGQRLSQMPHENVRAVGTNTLRQVRPESRFLAAAEAALGHPIDVIAGREEARLIYLGVARGLAAGDSNRLVVDIGGGSTEVIVGRGFEPVQRESLHMGCVSMSQRFFSNDKITEKSMKKAELHGALEVRPVREQFRRAGCQTAVGSSGTIKAIRTVIEAEGFGDNGITLAALDELRRALIAGGRISTLDLKGLSEERRPVFAGGVAVLRSVFETLGIERMQVSDMALREGLIYEMMGRGHAQDEREATVTSLGERFSIDAEQAERVRDTANWLWEQAAEDWSLADPRHPATLCWAARLHEIGLVVSHSQYQKHGAYLLDKADLPGFTRSEQSVLAALVSGHRRKFPLQTFHALPLHARQCSQRLCVLLRLAVLMHRGRSIETKPRPRLRTENEHIDLRFPDGWLDAHPLTRLELEQEAARLAGIDITLDFG